MDIGEFACGCDQPRSVPERTQSFLRTIPEADSDHGDLPLAHGPGCCQVDDPGMLARGDHPADHSVNGGHEAGTYNRTFAMVRPQDG